MRIRKHLSYANVIATLAFVLSLAGGAYAITDVGSHDIVNNSIKSIDLKNREGVGPRDVKRNSLTGKQIDERKLDASAFAPMAGAESPDCHPNSPSFIECAGTTLRVRTRSHLFIVATGNQETVSGVARAVCEVRSIIDRSLFSTRAKRRRTIRLAPLPTDSRGP